MASGNETVVYLSEQVVVLCSCALSFLGSSLIILTYVLWADLRTTPRRLLVFLSVSDWLSAVSYAFGVWRMFRSDSIDCVVQGAVSTFANTSSFFWTVAIAVYLYVFIVRSNQRVADSLVLVFHLVSWGVPLIITLAAVSLNKIGYDASEVSVGWCWVSIHAPDRVLWMLVTGKIWEFLAYLTLPVLYILIKRHIHIAHTALSEYRPILATRPPSFSSMADTKLTLIPVIFIVLRIWSTLRFILLLADSPVRQHPVLVTLHGIGNTSQGAANCIMFVLFTRPLRTRLCSALCCCSSSRCRAGSKRSQDPSHTLLPDQEASTQREEDDSSKAGSQR
ncbi:G-protein coupled receptor 157 [Limanda limanda]|uniref:G-protein coupled receptor 157 n=1 Tax=Limanda limanda TaxID=27771 RepID=UPI0029C78455|nr:G-protein coupled receptor 157 [Limanda limanda]